MNREQRYRRQIKREIKRAQKKQRKMLSRIDKAMSRRARLKLGRAR